MFRLNLCFGGRSHSDVVGATYDVPLLHLLLRRAAPAGTPSALAAANSKQRDWFVSVTVSDECHRRQRSRII